MFYRYNFMTYRIKLLAFVVGNDSLYIRVDSGIVR